MRNRFLTSILWLWIAALLSASVGVSVHQIYCYCAGKTSVSIFSNPVDACMAKMAKLRAGCCEKNKPGCCSEKPIANQKGRGCAQKTVKVYILKAEFLVSQPLDKTFDYPIWADEFPEYLRLFRPVLCECLVSNKAPPPPPPPLSGRIRCLVHQLFRC